MRIFGLAVNYQAEVQPSQNIYAVIGACGSDTLGGKTASKKEYGFSCSIFASIFSNQSDR
jgi:hypothetical protein